MAQASGLSVSSVQRIWRAFGLQPTKLELGINLKTAKALRRPSRRHRSRSLTR